MKTGKGGLKDVSHQKQLPITDVISSVQQNV